MHVFLYFYMDYFYYLKGNLIKMNLVPGKLYKLFFEDHDGYPGNRKSLYKDELTNLCICSDITRNSLVVFLEGPSEIERKGNHIKIYKIIFQDKIGWINNIFYPEFIEID